MTTPTETVDVTRLNGIISPLRRGLLRAARSSEHLPDLPDAQIEVLRALPEHVVRSPSEIADELSLSRTTVSNLLRTMEESGLVIRGTAADDRRRVEVRASAHAVSLLRRFDRASAGILESAVETMTDADRRALQAALPALERLRDEMQAAAHGASSDVDVRSGREERP